MRHNPETGLKLISGSLFAIIIGVLILVIFLALKPNDIANDYEILIIKGMTCIEYNGSLTCNWDEWETAE